MPPIYHGDVDGTYRALVYHDFGWDALDMLRDNGLSDPALYLYWSYMYGYLGIQFYFVATKQ